MGKKAIIVSLFVFLLIIPMHAQKDKDRKTFELIYQDIQVLKEQILSLEEKLKVHAEDIKANKARLEEILNQIRNTQARQAELSEELRAIPSQYQVLLERLEEMSLQLIKITEELLVLKNYSRVSPAPQEKPVGTKQTPPSKTPVKQKQEKEEPQEKQKPRELSLSPQEVYNMAYSDYLKGNFELAIEGFKTYTEHFPESPLADNAQYWIGECYFSQEKYAESIREFDELILKFPDSDKTASSYLKKGISLTKLGKKEEAIATYKLLISKFPLSEETKIAQEKIKELTSENERY